MAINWPHAWLPALYEVCKEWVLFFSSMLHWLNKMLTLILLIIQLWQNETQLARRKKLVWQDACLCMCVCVSKKDLMSDILPIVKLEPGFLGWREEDDMVIYKIQVLYAKLLLVRTAQPEERICQILSNVPLIPLNQHRPPVFDVYLFYCTGDSEADAPV